MDKNIKVILDEKRERILEKINAEQPTYDTGYGDAELDSVFSDGLIEAEKIVEEVLSADEDELKISELKVAIVDRKISEIIDKYGLSVFIAVAKTKF